jgi:hypothetical protein
MLSLSPDFNSGQHTRNQLEGLGAQRDRFGSLRERAFSAINNAPQKAVRTLRNAGSLAAQQKLGDQQTGAFNQADALRNSLARAKARTGIVTRGEPAVRNQQLKNRLAQVRSGIGTQGRGIQTQLQGQNTRFGVEGAIHDSRAGVKAARANAIGGALGGLTASLFSNKTDNDSFFDFGQKGPGIFSKRKVGTVTEQPFGGDGN